MIVKNQCLKCGETEFFPRCAVEALMDMLIVNAMVKCDAVTFVISCRFLQMEMSDDKIVVLIIRNYFVNMIHEVNHECEKHVRIANRTMVLCVKVLRVIHSYVELSML